MNGSGGRSFALAWMLPAFTSMRPSAPMPTRRKTSPSQNFLMRSPGRRPRISDSIERLTCSTVRAVETVKSMSAIGRLAGAAGRGAGRPRVGQLLHQRAGLVDLGQRLQDALGVDGH